MDFELNDYELVAKDFNKKAKKVDYPIIKAENISKDGTFRIKIEIQANKNQ